MKVVINRRKIEELRIERGLSLKQFGEAAGVSWTTIHNAIYCDTVPIMGTLKKIADALGVKVLEIVSIEDGDDPQNHKRPGRKRKAQTMNNPA